MISVVRQAFFTELFNQKSSYTYMRCKRRFEKFFWGIFGNYTTVENYIICYSIALTAIKNRWFFMFQKFSKTK